MARFVRIEFEDGDGSIHRLSATSGEKLESVLHRNWIPTNSVLVTRKGVPVPISSKVQDSTENWFVEMAQSFATQSLQKIPLRTTRVRKAVYAKDYLDFKGGSIVRKSIQLTSKQFTRYVEDTFVSNVLRHKMIETADHIVVGFSGGSDSVFLLRLLRKCASRLPKFELTAITLDLPISGRLESIGARDFCNELGVRQVTVSEEEVRRVFHLNTSFAKAYAQIEKMEREKPESSVDARVALHHVIRRCIEFGAQREDADKIILGIEEGEFGTALLSTLTTGLTLPGLHTRRSPDFVYVYPHYNITKVEVMLYLRLNMEDYYKRVVMRRTRYVSDPILTLYLATYAQMMETWPGIQYHFYEGFERLRSKLGGKIRFKRCRCCDGWFVESSEKVVNLCDACDAFRKAGCLR